MTISAEQVNIRASASFGSTIGKEVIELDYTEPTATTGTKRLKIPLDMTANQTGITLNLATYFTTVLCLGVYDRGGTGFKVGTGATNKFSIAANGMLLTRFDGSSAVPTLTIDNLSAVTAGSVEVFAMGT